MHVAAWAFPRPGMPLRRRRTTAFRPIGPGRMMRSPPSAAWRWWWRRRPGRAATCWSLPRCGQAPSTPGGPRSAPCAPIGGASRRIGPFTSERARTSCKPPSGGPGLSCWTLGQGRRPSSPCPLPIPWGRLTHMGHNGAWARARTSWRPTATQIACLWGAGPGRRSAGGTCNASIQRGHPWALPPPGPQPRPAPPRWAPRLDTLDGLTPAGGGAIQFGRLSAGGTSL